MGRAESKKAAGEWIVKIQARKSHVAAVRRVVHHLLGFVHQLFVRGRGASLGQPQRVRRRRHPGGRVVTPGCQIGYMDNTGWDVIEVGVLAAK